MKLFIVCVIIYSVVVRSYGAAVYNTDTDYIEATIRNYFADTRHHTENPTYKNRSKEYISHQFSSFGLEVHEQEFQEYMDAEMDLVSFWNVIGVLKGEDFGTASDRIIGIGAHYDTVNTTKGVDDNGSGMAVLLNVAKKLTKDKIKRKNTIIFAAFDLEEMNIMGSRYFINSWLYHWLSNEYGSALNNIRPHGVIILDTIMEFNTSSFSQGVPGNETLFQQVFPSQYQSVVSDNLAGDFIAVIYRETEDFALAGEFKTSWAKQGRENMEIEMFGLPSYWSNYMHYFFDFLRSDHVNFWSTQMAPAIWLTDSANFRGDMQYCYHQPCDNVEVMLTDENIAFMGKISDSLVATIDRLSEPISGDPSLAVSMHPSFTMLLWLLCISFAKSML